MPTTEERIAEALESINKEFAQALGGKIEDELTGNSRKVWEEKAFPQTIKHAIIQNGNNWFRTQANQDYVLEHVRLIARVARYFRAKAKSARISESQLKNAIDLVIEQARYSCPVTKPGRSCAGYKGIASLDV